MWKLFLFIIMFLSVSCNRQSTDNIKKNKEIKKTIHSEIKIKKHDFKAVLFDKDTKDIYRNKKDIVKVKELKFNKLFKKIKNKAVTIQFYVRFEKFSSLPDIYKNRVKENKIFYLLGVNIGDNYILTELNILKEAYIIFLKDNDGINELELVGYDENYNIALLKSPKKINKKKVDILKIKDSEFLPGDLVFSLFSISNEHFSFRKHFINFLHYSEFYEIVDSLYSQSVSYIENSGGIVFDSAGKFLGIISLYDSYYENSGFIVTYQIIKKILPKLKRGYRIKNNAWLGLYLKHGNSNTGTINTASGYVTVRKVINNSPAYTAGIKVGDKITEINNTRIKSKKDVKRIMNFANSGNILKIKVQRDAKLLKFQVKLIDKPLKYLYKGKKYEKIAKRRDIGIKLMQENNQIMISEVEEGSLAFIYGVKVGDKLLEISGKKIKSIKEYEIYVNNLQKNKSIKIKLLRGKEIKLIAFKKS